MTDKQEKEDRDKKSKFFRNLDLRTKCHLNENLFKATDFLETQWKLKANKN